MLRDKQEEREPLKGLEVNKMKKETLLNKLEAVKARSAWSKGVKIYAAELVADIEEDDIPEDYRQLTNLLLNGAMTWKDYSWAAVP